MNKVGKFEGEIRFTLESIFIKLADPFVKYRLQLALGSLTHSYLPQKCCGDQMSQQQGSQLAQIGRSIIFRIGEQFLLSGNEIINEIILFAKKDNNSELEEEYSEIGKGKIDIVDVFGEELQSVSYVSGLIYGNRVENQRNVLAKFKYRIGFRVISDLTINTKSISQIMIGNDKGREEKKYVDKQPKEFIRLNQGELLSLSSQKQKGSFENGSQMSINSTKITDRSLSFVKRNDNCHKIQTIIQPMSFNEAGQNNHNPHSFRKQGSVSYSDIQFLLKYQQKYSYLQSVGCHNIVRIELKQIKLLKQKLQKAQVTVLSKQNQTKETSNLRLCYLFEIYETCIGQTNKIASILWRSAKQIGNNQLSVGVKILLPGQVKAFALKLTASNIVFNMTAAISDEAQGERLIDLVAKGDKCGCIWINFIKQVIFISEQLHQEYLGQVIEYKKQIATLACQKLQQQPKFPCQQRKLFQRQFNCRVKELNPLPIEDFPCLKNKSDVNKHRTIEYNNNGSVNIEEYISQRSKYHSIQYLQQSTGEPQSQAQFTYRKLYRVHRGVRKGSLSLVGQRDGRYQREFNLKMIGADASVAKTSLNLQKARVSPHLSQQSMLIINRIALNLFLRFDQTKLRLQLGDQKYQTKPIRKPKQLIWKDLNLVFMFHELKRELTILCEDDKCNRLIRKYNRIRGKCCIGLDQIIKVGESQQLLLQMLSGNNQVVGKLTIGFIIVHKNYAQKK